MTEKTIREIVIGVLAIVSIVLIAWEALVSVSTNTLVRIYVADLIICVVFAADFIHRLRTSESKARFMKTNGYEIIAMIPAIAFSSVALPTIATALRSVRMVRVVRVVLMITRMRRAMSKQGKFLSRSHLLTMLAIVVGVVFVGAFAVFVLEAKIPDAQITSFSDAVWWSISTITTVGYGDIVPKSYEGRVMGMVLMVIGIGIMATFISQVSATLVESRIKGKEERSDLRTRMISEVKSGIDHIDKMSDGEVSLLIQMIQTLRAKGGE